MSDYVCRYSIHPLVYNHLMYPEFRFLQVTRMMTPVHCSVDFIHKADGGIVFFLISIANEYQRITQNITQNLASFNRKKLTNPLFVNLILFNWFFMRLSYEGIIWYVCDFV